MHTYVIVMSPARKEFAEALGYMENEIDLKFAIGEKYKYSEHPINTISPDDENKQMLNKINGLIKNIQLAKNQIDEWKVSTPTKYLDKSKKPILAMNVYTINFINGDGSVKFISWVITFNKKPIQGRLFIKYLTN